MTAESTPKDQINADACVAFDFTRKPVHLSQTGRVATTVLMLMDNVSMDDLVRSTGFDSQTIEEEMKKIKKEVGGVKGSAKKGYSLVQDSEKVLKLSRWRENQYFPD